MTQPGGYGQPDPQQSPNYGQDYGQPQPGYGQQPPAYGAAGGYGGQEHPQTQTVFILGIVGIFVGVCAFIAWYMGGQAKKEIDAGAPYAWEGTKLKTGYMLGKVFSIIYICLIVLYIVVLIILLATGLGAASVYGG
ncbi:hypothetical protein BW730_15300 [Tessaracoccus aquimaris]|uniref:DUF4190 domain-containing protein n=1 Tax=Tessaracoccus aquimaris TaxID=1332264 RepID=A0A1Q2CRC6_9ACTN|nr:hypothetical protein [Tessaracoccus aquimaris]AQP48666.1 hypothetical protein BW730_15300 [Tessaracoccus aquimaris]